MAQVPTLDFDTFVKQKRAERAAGGAESSEHEYSYVLDRQTRAAFERMKPFELAVAAAVRVFKQVGKSQMLGNAVRVSERQFPRIHAITMRCAETLHIRPPQVYVVNNPHLNAATYGTNEDAFIMIHSALIDHYTDDELLTVIGHECGHIHNSHVVYLTALHYLATMAGMILRVPVQPIIVSLRAWTRRAEITCDRAGMLCGKDVKVAERALAKLALGSHKLYEDFNLDAFLEQYDEGKESVGRFMEVFATHPWLPKRILAMRVFGESKFYQRAAGLPEEGLTMSEVDDRVKALLKGDA
jgi:Zn-dependent protease with chaperone function